MKFAQVVQGTRAVRRCEVPGFTTADGAPFAVLLRPLTGVEHENAHATARQRAKDKGVEAPAIGDPIFDIALMAAVLVVGCVDPDSATHAPSFDSAEQILSLMHPEQIVFLHEQHEAWQDECSPFTRKLEKEKLVDLVREVAGSDGLATFMRLSPSTRVNFALSMARMLLLSLPIKSLSGSDFESISTTVDAAPKKSKKSARSRPS